MDPLVVSVAGLVVLVVLIICKVPIAYALMGAGVMGFALETGWGPALTILADEPATTLGSVDLGALPLFILMGTFASAAGFSQDMYAAAAAFLGHRRGGLAYATLGGCAGFGAVCGSSTATAATFGQVALPEMIRRGYSSSFSAGVVAAGGTLKSLIPPAIVMIIYAITTRTLIYDLFAAAIIPAFLTIALNFAAIAVTVRMNPAAAPVLPRIDWTERIIALRKAGQAILLILTVFGGFYSGLFTISESASMAAVLAFVFALLRGRLRVPNLIRGFTAAAGVTAMLFAIIIGANVVTYFLTFAHVPDVVVNAVGGLDFPPPVIIVLILVAYLILGAIFDEFAAMLITLPFTLPIIVGLHYDPIWWGIINVIIIELGMIIPPMGLIVFLLHAQHPSISLKTMYVGVIPFVLADLVVLFVLILFPELALWLPHSLMR